MKLLRISADNVEYLSTTRGRRFATTESRIRCTAWHLTGLVQETQQYRDMFEESRAAHSATGPEDFYDKYDIKTMTEQDLMLDYYGIGQT